MISLKPKSIQLTKRLIEDFCHTEEIPKRISNKIIRSLTKGEFYRLPNYEMFVLADALGCDDLGLVSENSELQSLYDFAWAKSQVID